MKLSPTTYDILESQRKSKDNSLNFEKCSYFEKYENSLKGITSQLGLCMGDNMILKRLIPYLKGKSKTKIYAKEAAKRFYNRPLALSYEEYGRIDFWWIILAINDYINPQDFHDWTSLIIPSLEEISLTFDKESYLNNEIGVIPE